MLWVLLECFRRTGLKGGRGPLLGGRGGSCACLLSSNFFHKLSEIFLKETILLKFYLFQLLGYNSIWAQLMEEIEYFISPGLSLTL